MHTSALSLSHLRLQPSSATMELEASAQDPHEVCVCFSAFPALAASYSAPRDWATLPPHLVESILSLLVTPDSADLKACYAVVGTCSTWRAIGFPLLFADVWRRQKSIVHPSQLLSLAPASADISEIRCFVVRRRTPWSCLAGQSTTFEFWLGEHNSPPAERRFLLGARQLSKSSFSIGLTRLHASAARTPASSLRSCAVKGEVATLLGNLQRTQYSLWASPKPWVHAAICRGFGHTEGSSSGSSGPSSGTGMIKAVGVEAAPARRSLLRSGKGTAGSPLLKVSYCMRMNGLLLPRRLTVEVAQPCPAACIKPIFADRNRGPHEDETMAPNEDEDAELAHELPTPRQGSQPAAGLPGSVAAGEAEGVPGEGSGLPTTMQLQNLLPHWNTHLKCWCLNFHNRVKMPSIKNFQLASSEDSGSGVLLQFGKVEADVFVMDFNPSAMSSLQAFALALSNFEHKYALWSAAP